MSAALAVRRSEWEPISQSHQGQRHKPHQKSGCTGAIYPSNHHESFAWQTGGVHGASRMRPQRLRKQCFIEDEGRPLGVGLQELASNHLKLRGLRVRVVSVEEKAERIPSDEC